jgi:hypothetical protein
MKLGMRVIAGFSIVVMASAMLGCVARAAVRPPPARATVIVR